MHTSFELVDLIEDNVLDLLFFSLLSFVDDVVRHLKRQYTAQAPLLCLVHLTTNQQSGLQLTLTLSH